MSDYIFPNAMAKIMSKISQRTQYEASMMALTFILIGLLVYHWIILFGEYSIFFKVGFTVNSAAGIVLLGSYLITTYQQYKSYKEQMGLYKTDEEEYNEMRTKYIN